MSERKELFVVHEVQIIINVPHDPRQTRISLFYLFHSIHARSFKSDFHYVGEKIASVCFSLIRKCNFASFTLESSDFVSVFKPLEISKFQKPLEITIFCIMLFKSLVCKEMNKLA